MTSLLGSIPGMRRWHCSVAGALVVSAMTSPNMPAFFEYGTTYPDVYLLRRALFMPWELPKLMDPDMARLGWAELEEGSFHGRSIDWKRRGRNLGESTWYMRSQLLRDSDWCMAAFAGNPRAAGRYIFLPGTGTDAGIGYPTSKLDMAASPAKPLPGRSP